MERQQQITLALDHAWHRQTAEASFERWQELCTKEQWGNIPERVADLIAVFGASWYFTRFVFYRGRKSATVIDNPPLESFDARSLERFLSQALQAEEQEQQLEWLRSLKNQAMLQLLVARIARRDDIAASEVSLTHLAIATLKTTMQIAGIEFNDPDRQFAVLGMGRIAGYEMNFGSDLDLIFLHDGEDPDFRVYFSEKIRFLLRTMSMQSATGLLYEVDMRLRPHGTSGALVTSLQSFLAHHSSDRETWERQMMTRCSSIVDPQGLGGQALQQIQKYIYRDPPYPSLAEDILNIRTRVEKELGSRKGKFDIKRDAGGIMDIDFLTHYLQLKNGASLPELQISSTRQLLSLLCERGFLSGAQYQCLQEAYDFFKAVEACLRLFDMKSISTFPLGFDNETAIVRASGFCGEDAADKFRDHYNTLTGKVRKIYTEVLGNRG